MFPHKAGSAWEIFAPAKLNLYLDVLGRRPDGFHELETLMVPVQVYDHLRWFDSDEPLSLKISNQLSTASLPQLRDTSQNLVMRAARLLAETAGVQPRGNFELTKRIPVEAGMGGGSSDAAATLLLANAAWKLNYSIEQLHPLAEQLGSDVPFFLYNSPAICRGRGERVEPLRQLPKLHFVVIKPPAALSTAEVFSNLDAITPTQDLGQQLVRSLQLRDFASLKSQLYNALEIPAAKLSGWVLQLRKVFQESQAVAQLLTGSGSAYFGIMRSAIHARNTARRLTSLNLGTVIATSTC